MSAESATLDPHDVLPGAEVARAATVREEIRALAALSIPVIFAQVGSMMLGLVDTMMISRVGTAALDAAALGNLWTFGTLIIGMGLVLGIDPIVSQAHGARDGRAAALGLQRGIVVAFLASAPIALLWIFTEPVLVLAGQDPALAAAAASYVHVQLPTMPAFLVFTALRQYLQGRGILAPTVWVIVGANVINAAANYLLIFGGLGAPALGLVGAGIASAIARLFMAGVLAAWIFRGGLSRGAWIPWSREAISPRGIGEVMRYGIPVGLQYGFEIWAFQIATLLAGLLGHAPLGAHTLVLNMASFSFMFPMGISHGAATRVGNLIGAREHASAQRAAWVAFGMGGAVMLGAAAIFLAFRAHLPRLYGPEAAVAALASTLLPVVAAFQLFDGLQAVGGGILRGMGRIRPAAVFNLVGYYALALPLSAWLAFSKGMGLVGLWWGLAIGLMVISLSLMAWVGARGPATMASR